MSNISKPFILLSTFGIVALSFCAAIFILDWRLFDFQILALSFLFFLIISCAILSEKDIFSPVVFFSILFYGYAFSGLYFSRYTNIDHAKFFVYYGSFSTDDIKASLITVIVGYVFFIFGYKLTPGFRFGSTWFGFARFEYNSVFFVKTLIIFYILSFSYWIYVSFLLANGPFDLLSNVGIYLLLLEGSGVSTAPYLVAYAATSLIFLLYLKKGLRIPVYVKAMIMVGFLMNVSTARLAGSVVYLLSFPLMYALHAKYRIGVKSIFYFVLAMFVLGALYFYRYNSNLKYLGLTIEGDFLDILGEHFFGMTNVGDLQSIVFSWQYIKDVGYLYGESFFDIFALWAAKFSLSSIEEVSIGVRLRDYYFSHVDTGAPAPGIISEMIMNFGFIGVTLGMMTLGVLIHLFANIFRSDRGVVSLYIYAHYLLFLLLLAKVDSTHLNALIWSVFPVLVLVFVLNGIARIQSCNEVDR